MLKKPLFGVAIAICLTILPGRGEADPAPSGPTFVMRQLTGDLIRSAEAAISIVEVIIEQNYGRDRMLEQRPMSAAREGDLWRVEGSYNYDGSAGMIGPVTVRIRGADCQVQSLLFKTQIESPAVQR